MVRIGRRAPPTPSKFVVERGRDDPFHVLRVNVPDDLRQQRRLLEVPAVHSAELGRPIEDVRLVVVLENPDISSPDGLAQAFIVVLHRCCL
jgi:hypothetical protein